MSGELPPRRFVKLLRGAPLHRKFQRLGRVLEVSRFEAFGLTAALWDWTDENRPDGDLSGLDAEDIADSIGASDRFDPDELVAGLLEVGLLDRDEAGQLRVHGWTDEGRSGSDHEARTEKARNAAHILWHVKKKNPKPDTCRLCRLMPEGASPQMPEGASPHMPEGASSTEDRQRTRHPTTERVDARGGMPEGASQRMPEAARSGMPDEDEDEDDQESLKEKAKERTRQIESAPVRVYTPDDPERPFILDEVCHGS